MSTLRNGATTSLQEIDSITDPDFCGGIAENPDILRGSVRRGGDPILQMRLNLERQFEAANEHLAAVQWQTLKGLQESCVAVINKQASTQQFSKQTVATAWTEQSAWNEPHLTIPGSPLMPNSGTFTERPCTPLGIAPEMPEPTVSTEVFDMRPPSRNALPKQHTLFAMPYNPVDKEKAEMKKNARRFTQFQQKRKTMENIVAANLGEQTGPRQGAIYMVPRAVFADAAAMKAKVKENIMKPEYNVAQYYHEQGWSQRIARSAIFDSITLAIIFLNALWIWVDTDYNDSPTLLDAHPLFQVVENLFCVYFCGELIIRFTAFKVKWDCVKDAWFVFDSGLVFMMVAETWILNLIVWSIGEGSSTGLGNASILRLVRLLRLTRMARMVRILRATPELMILVKGMSVAARSVMFTLMLLMILLYVFAIAFRQLTAEDALKESHFKTVPEAMITLLLQGILPDEAKLVTDLGDANYFFGFCAIGFLLLSSLTVMNMLVGILVEVVSVVSAVEKETMAVNFVKSKLLTLIHGIDKDNDLRISRDEFEALLLLPEGARVIQEVGVDVVGLVDYADHIFKEGAELSFADVMDLVLQLRGSNTATVKDVVDLRKFLTQLATESHDHTFDRMTDMVRETVSAIVDQKLQIDQKLQESLKGNNIAVGL